MEHASPGTQVNAAGRVWIRLLGGWSITGVRAGPLSRSGRRLLTYLSLYGRTSRRELAGIIWPNATEDHAQGSLRTTLWRLRNIDRNLVAGSVDELWLGPHVSVDVHEVMTVVRRILAGEPCTDLSALPAGLLRGDLAPGMRDEWLIIDRERMRQLRLHALEALAAGFAATGRHHLALEAGTAAVLAAPLRESAHRVVVTEYLWLGRVAEARRQVESFRSRLQAQLGIGPSQRFLDLVAAGPQAQRGSG